MNFAEGETRFNNLNDTRAVYDMNDNLVAEGVAPVGSATDQPVWTIRRKFYNDKGLVVRTTMKKKVKWDDWETIT